MEMPSITGWVVWVVILAAIMMAIVGIVFFKDQQGLAQILSLFRIFG